MKLLEVSYSCSSLSSIVVGKRAVVLIATHSIILSEVGSDSIQVVLPLYAENILLFSGFSLRIKNGLMDPKPIIGGYF